MTTEEQSAANSPPLATFDLITDVQYANIDDGFNFYKTSPHESGLAIDVNDNAAWRTAMENNGCRWQGTSDPG